MPRLALNFFFSILSRTCFKTAWNTLYKTPNLRYFFKGMKAFLTMQLLFSPLAAFTAKLAASLSPIKVCRYIEAVSFSPHCRLFCDNPFQKYFFIGEKSFFVARHIMGVERIFYAGPSVLRKEKETLWAPRVICHRGRGLFSLII